MRPPRPVLSAFACVVLLLSAALASGSAPGRVSLLERRPDGRDTVRVLGDGDGARFMQIENRLHAAQVTGSSASQRYLVTFAEPSVAADFAARVSERQALAQRFGHEVARRGAGHFDASGRALPRVLHGYDRLVAGALVLAAPHSEAMLRAIPGVRAVFPDLRVTADDGASLSQVRADLVQRDLGASGLGVRVGIIDTGVDYGHAAFGSGFGPGQRVAGGWDFVNDDADPRDDNGHGTHVAGIVAGNGGGVLGMAPAATLYAYKVLDANGGGWLGDVLTALERCADPDQDPATPDRLDAVNVSLGSPAQYDEDPATRAVDALDALGTVVVVAAGNAGRGFSVATPAIAPHAIAVGSVNVADEISTFSSQGPTVGLRIKPDLVAPGEAISSASLAGGYATLSGTSMATPHVTGAAALLRQLHPEWTAEEVRSALVTRTLNLQRSAVVQGSGRLDVFASATSTLFVSPTSLAFGRARTGDRGWVRAETLRVHSRAATATSATLSLSMLSLPWWIEPTLEPRTLMLEPGVPAEAVLTLREIADHAPLPDSPYLVEGAVQVLADGQRCRVPFSVHECLELQLIANGGAPSGTVIGRGRALAPLSAFGATWLLQPGLYDVLTFNDYRAANEPFLGLTDLAISSDTLLAVVQSTETADLTWDLRDERGDPHMPQTLTFMLQFQGGGGLGVIGRRGEPRLRFPVMRPGYRLEWWAYDPDGLQRYDIPGREEAPLTTRSIQNDPGALRRLVEHMHVPAGDSLLMLEFPLYTEGEGYFGFAFWSPFVTPYGESFDVVRWTAPVPDRRQLRFGHTTWSVDPVKARAFDPEPFNGASPVWDQRHGDTLWVAPRGRLGEPLARFTGRDLPFGSGAVFPCAWFLLNAGGLEVYPVETSRPNYFRDGAGSIAHAPPVAFELRRDAVLIDSGTIDESVLADPYGRWRREVPGSGPVELTLRTSGWTVAGAPSTTTVVTAFDESKNWFARQAPEWFSIVAGGAPTDRIAFGLHRDPHVELRITDRPEITSVTIAIRVGEGGAWMPLEVTRQGSTFRAAIPRVLGEVSMRVGFRTEGFAPMTVEMTPAFRGEPSPAVDAQVLQARADGQGAHLEWRVGAPGAAVLVERFESAHGWSERGERTVDPDGVVRFDDPAVAPGARYGYRLGGSEAAVFLEIPQAGAGLSFTLGANPSTDGLLASVVLDRDAPVTLRVHDLQGRVVASRTWTGLGPGLHVLPVLPRGRAKAGLYFVRLEREGEIRDRRVTILE